MSSDSVNEKLDATDTGYGSIKDEPKAGGGLKLIVIGMLIGTFIGVVGTMALISPHSPLAQYRHDGRDDDDTVTGSDCPLCCPTFP